MSQSQTQPVDERQESKRGFRNPLDVWIEAIAGRFGEKSKEVARFLRFAIVGISGAVLDFTVLIVLQATLLPPSTQSGEALPFNVTLATGIAFFVAVISNFIWTRLWVYPDSRSRSIRRQLAQFTIISVTGGAARTIWVTLMYYPIGHLMMPTALPIFRLFSPEYEPSVTAEEKLGTIIAQMIAMVVVMLWNFFANRYWTYNDVD